jgi:hypothetical protein
MGVAVRVLVVSRPQQVYWCDVSGGTCNRHSGKQLDFQLRGGWVGGGLCTQCFSLWHPRGISDQPVWRDWCLLGTHYPLCEAAWVHTFASEQATTTPYCLCVLTQ